MLFESISRLQRGQDGKKTTVEYQLRTLNGWSQVRLLDLSNHGLLFRNWEASEGLQMVGWCGHMLHVFKKNLCVWACVYLQGNTNVCCVSHWLIATSLQPSVWCPGRPSNKHTVILWPWISASRLVYCSPPRATVLGRCNFQQQPCHYSSTFILPVHHCGSPPIYLELPSKVLGYGSRRKHQ